MPEIEIITVRTLAEMQQALAVRRSVFIEEQRVPEALEIDEHDGDPAVVRGAFHVLAIGDGAAVATGRLLLPHGAEDAHIGRVAVLKQHRRGGYGRSVMLALQALAAERGLWRITLAAQLHAIGFYERLGYVARDATFLDAGIEHRWMDIDLRSE